MSQQATASEEERWTVPEEQLEARKELVDQVGTDLRREEQESGLSFFADDGRFKFTTYVPALVRGLLSHDYARIEWVYVTNASDRRERVEDITSISNAGDTVSIEGIQVSLPLGCLLMKGLPRKRDRPSSILSIPERARRAERDFGEDDE